MRTTIAFVVFVSVYGCADDQPPIATTPIRSADELSAYLSAAHSSPLDRLPPPARQRFLDSLVFGDHELGGFRYEDLQALPADDVYQILHLFGAERTAPMVLRANPHAQAPRVIRGPAGEDHENYYCHSPHNCNTNPGWICMSGC